MENKKNGQAIAGFVCSLCGILTCGISSIVGLILSIIGLKKSKELNNEGKGLSIAGIIISIVYFVVIILLAIILLISYGTISNAIENARKNNITDNYISSNTENNYEDDDNEEDTTDEKYNDVTLENSGFKEVSVDEYLNLVKQNEKSIVLITRPTCTYCQKFMPVIKEVQVEMNLDINYVNTNNISSEDWDKFTNSLDYLKNNNWGTPTILIVKNNDLVDINMGYDTLTNTKAFFSKNGY